MVRERRCKHGYQLNPVVDEDVCVGFVYGLVRTPCEVVEVLVIEADRVLTNISIDAARVQFSVFGKEYDELIPEGRVLVVADEQEGGDYIDPQMYVPSKVDLDLVRQATSAVCDCERCEEADDG